MNGIGFKPFDMVIPFSVRKGEITGKYHSINTFCRSFSLPTMLYMKENTLFDDVQFHEVKAQELSYE